ncbi:MAG: serine/threonine protein kinase [Rubrivivax sp.]|nr:serine/threonine protein kinase [Rubrivivax sp.]
MGYEDLTPQQVLAALDAVGLRGDGRILQLNSYENRVFQLFLEDGRAVVAKFYRPGRWSDAQILEEHAFALELAEAEVPVVPPLVLAAQASVADGSLPAGSAPSAARCLGAPPTLAHFAGHRLAVAARCAGREPELEAAGVLQRIGRFIGRLHAVGRRRAFLHRHRLDAAADGRRAIDLLAAGGFVPPEQQAAWRDAAERAQDSLARAFAAAGPLGTLRLHGDCHIGNVLWRHAGDGEGPHLVDLDDAMQGPAVQDLWMLVSGDAAGMSRQFGELLAGYTQFSDFDPHELALVEPLRTLRMLRHSAWLAERWSDPTFPIHFPFFGTAAYWSQQTAQLREQVELMREATGRAAG